jgi:hypothetical protein
LDFSTTNTLCTWRATIIAAASARVASGETESSPRVITELTGCTGRSSSGALRPKALLARPTRSKSVRVSTPTGCLRASITARLESVCSRRTWSASESGASSEMTCTGACIQRRTGSS